MYEAVRLTGYTICLVVRMHFCVSECASKTTPPVDRTRLVMAARMIAFDFPCLVFSIRSCENAVETHMCTYASVPCGCLGSAYHLTNSHSMKLQGCVGMGVASGWPSSEFILVVVACFATLLPYDRIFLKLECRASCAHFNHPSMDLEAVHHVCTPMEGL